MTEIFTFRDVIDLFGGSPEFARKRGIKGSLAANMYRRNSIGANHFDDIVRIAQAEGHKQVTHELMCQIAAGNIGKSGAQG